MISTVYIFHATQSLITSAWGLHDVLLSVYIYFLSQKVRLDFDYVGAILGIGEDEWVAAQCKFLDEAKTQLRNIYTREVFQCGNFQEVSIGEVKRHLPEIPYEPRMITFVCLHPKNKPTGDNIVDTYRNVFTSPMKHSCFEELQAHIPDATFQVSSHYNCIESYDDEHIPTNDSLFVTSYEKQYAQGAKASLCAMPGAILRARGAGDINLLSDVSEYFPTKNGYIALDEHSKFLPQNEPEQMEEIMSKIKFGSHSDVDNVFGHAVDGFVEKHRQSVHQVLVSCCDVARSKVGRTSREFHDVQTKCRFLLEAAYSSVYLAAAYEQKKRVVCTFFDNQWFGNYEEWQLTSFVKAHEQYSRYVEEVYFSYPRRAHIHPELEQLLKQRNIPFRIVYDWEGEEVHQPKPHNLPTKEANAKKED